MNLKIMLETIILFSLWLFIKLFIKFIKILIEKEETIK